MKRFFLFSLSIFFSLFIILLIPVAKIAKPFLPFAEYLLGVDEPTSYLILLGNDAEMRANGGFAGSYAKIVIARSEGDLPAGRQARQSIPLLDRHALLAMTNLNSEISFQDIYVPNGQIAGLFVKPPEPIQQAFGHGTWELANADWEPDFPSSAKTLRWFLEKGGEINPDILAILNLSTIKRILSLVGSFSVPEYSATLTPDNLYLFLQGKAELNFFPGSTQKKDALTAVGNALAKKIKSLSFIQKLRIAQILYTDFINQNIMVHSTNLSFQSLLEQKKLAGVFQPEAFDTYAMIETNLGANKANAFITRSTTHVIARRSPEATDAAIYTNNSIHHAVTIQFQNSSLEANPNPPLHYGGNYIAYLRLYIPENAQNISLSRTPEGTPPLPEESPRQVVLQGDSSLDSTLKISYGLTEIGFWHTTLAGGESTITLSYTLPCDLSLRAERGNLTPPCPYSLAILKQHGLVSSPQTISLFGQPLATNLTQSFYSP